ncbi:MAG: hypothetical protein KC940_16720 [Candidatus Omnitrophica bacterium]|nr:hypothetical protein [Candidatus Omnitrophota bacterium]
MNRTGRISFCFLLINFVIWISPALGEDVWDIGSRLSLFVDGKIVEEMDGTRLQLHHPIPAEDVIRFDNPWEGKYVGYVTIIYDGHLYRMYYRGMPEAGQDGSIGETTCYAESLDGVHWVKPNLGIHEVDGTLEYNAILANAAPFSHNFAPFLDKNPDCDPDQKFKALAGTGKTGLVPFASPDGIHWKKLRDEGVITKGAFDSQNVGFWSEEEGCYLSYFRIFSDGVRSISRTTSKDFLNWEEPVEMTYGDTPREHLYTNQTHPYFRAPHIYLAICARFMPGRRVISESTAKRLGGDLQYSGDCSDTVFMTTRGGNEYDRTFMEGFVRPGLGMGNWTSRTNYPAYGVVPTGDGEMSLYVQRNYGQPTHHLQRLTLRTDGFVSLHGPYQGGEATTRPFIFEGQNLVLNFATSAAGSAWVGLQDEEGNPIDGYGLEDCDEMVGDEIARKVTWKGNADLSQVAGKKVRLHFKLKDADVYSFRFQ